MGRKEETGQLQASKPGGLLCLPDDFLTENKGV